MGAGIEGGGLHAVGWEGRVAATLATLAPLHPQRNRLHIAGCETHHTTQHCPALSSTLVCTHLVCGDVAQRLFAVVEQQVADALAPQRIQLQRQRQGHRQQGQRGEG